MRTKASFIRCGALAAILLISSYVSWAQNVPVGIGALVNASASTSPVGGTPIFSITAPFSSSSFSGTLVSSVMSGDASNPFANGLTFTYQINLSPTGPQEVSEMTVSSFDSFLTDLSYNNTAGGVAPSFFSRSSENGGTTGDVLRFSFLSTPIGVDQSSALLVIETSATSYNISSAAIIDGVSVNVQSLAAASVVPEPASVGVLLMGLAGLGFVARRKAQLRR